MPPAGAPPPPPPPPPAPPSPKLKTPLASPGRPEAPPPPPPPGTVAATRPKPLDLQSELQLKSNSLGSCNKADTGDPPRPPATGLGFQNELAVRLSRRATPTAPSGRNPCPQSSSGQASLTSKATSPEPNPPTPSEPQRLSHSSEAPAAPPTPPFPVSPQFQDKPVEQSLSLPVTLLHLEGGVSPLQMGSSDRGHAGSPSVSIMLQRRQSLRRASMRRDKLHHPVLTANPMLEASEKPMQPIMLHPHNPDTHLGYADAPWALCLRKEYFSPVEKLSSGRELALMYHQVGGVC